MSRRHAIEVRCIVTIVADFPQSLHLLLPQELKFVLLLEVGHEVLAWDLVNRERELSVLEDGLDKPLLDRVMLIRVPELFHLLGCAFWDLLTLLQIGPKLVLI